MQNDMYADKCPCCGCCSSLKHNTNDILTYYGYKTYYVECDGCGLKTAYGDKDEVIRRWNRREYYG